MDNTPLICNEFIYKYFNDCIYTIPEHISFTLAIIGLLAAMSAQFPQYLTNYRLKDARGLSAGLVIFWTLGDMTNLIGTIYAKQLITQTLAAISFCLTDVIFVFQYLYYVYFYPRMRGDGYVPLPSFDVDIEQEGEEEVSLDDPECVPVESIQPRQHQIIKIALLSEVPVASARFISNTTIESTIISSISTLDEESIFGILMAWTSVSFYISSRIPQIIKNYNTKSVHGLSLTMFVLNVVGNLCYGTSVLIRLGEIDREFFLTTFPYMIGSWGVLMLDCTTLVQYYYYNR